MPNDYSPSMAKRKMDALRGEAKKRGFDEFGGMVDVAEIGIQADFSLPSHDSRGNPYRFIERKSKMQKLMDEARKRGFHVQNDGITVGCWLNYKHE